MTQTLQRPPQHVRRLGHQTQTQTQTQPLARGRARWWLAVPALLALAISLSAQADGGRLMPPQVPAAYAQECASCHIAYPPGLLPARSWRRLMGGLDQHFGSNASLDTATANDITRWLQAHAGTARRVTTEPPQDRITRSPWFERQHRQIDPAVWTLPSVKSAAQCAACHVGADQGVFDDDRLKYPAGMSARMRRGFND